MKPLATHERVLTWLCICPAEDGTSKWMISLYIIFISIAFVFEVSILVSSYVYFLKNMSDNLEEALYALAQISGFGGLIYTSFVSFYSRHEIVTFLETLAHIHTTNAAEESYHFLFEANEKSEWIWKFYLKIVMGGFCVSTMAMAIASASFGLILKGYFDLKHLYWPYRTTLPWNQYTPMGYFEAIFYQMLNGEIYLLLNGAILLLFISICLHHRAFYERFQHTVGKLDELKRKEFEDKIVRDLVQFHNMAKNWFLETAKVYSRYILIQLICTMMLLACAIFQVDLQIQHLDYSIITLLSAIVISAFNLFLYCLFGKMATESYGMMANCLYESNWYEHPISLQKYFILMIENSQRPLYYDGSGLSVLRLETFTSLVGKVFTFYMMFKRLTTLRL